MSLKRTRERRNDALTRVGWQSLETLLAEHYRREGFEVEHAGTGGTGARYDGGIDLKLRKGIEYIVVQVKHWNAYKVPHNTVHQLLGVMVNEGATGAIVVTSGEFTKAAVEAATRHRHVQLIDGAELRELLGPVADALDRGREVDRARQIAAAAQSAPSVRARPSEASARQAERNTTLLWWTIAVVGAVVFIALIRGVLEKSRWTAGPTPVSIENSTWNPVKQELGQRDTVAVRATPDPCREVIDHFSGTYVDHCAPKAPAAKPSAAERREQQRRADAAIRVLEATTPEVH